MNIKQKIKEHGLERILVVDDTIENLQGAREYFENMDEVLVDYASSQAEAIKMLQNQGNKYDLLLTDLEMETKESGYEVIREGIINNVFGIIATGFNYNPRPNDRHGPRTTFIPSKDFVQGKKTKPMVWEKALEHAIKYMDEFGLKKALDENKANDKKADKKYADIVLSLYKAERNI